MILLYHLVFPDSTPKDAWNAGLVLRLEDFKRQLLWLKSHQEILSLDNYLAQLKPEEDFLHGKFAITFDDGYRQVFDLIFPFLLKEKIPVTFFATTSHLEDHELLWFVYINALCSDRIYSDIEIEGQKYSLTNRRSSMIAWGKLIHLARESGTPINYTRDFAKKYPLPANIISKYEGLTQTQIVEANRSGLINMEGHTHRHPYLDQISKEAQSFEIRTNKSILESISGKPVNFFAYTGGVYNSESIDVVKEAGFKAAFAVISRQLGSDKRYEIPRVGIYSSSLIKFNMKINGYDMLLKRFMPRVR